MSLYKLKGTSGSVINQSFPLGETFVLGSAADCAVQIDGEVRRACVTEAKEGMKIRTDLPKHWVPLRIVGRTGGLPFGGVGTPWGARKNAKSAFLEICCLFVGLNFRCPQCLNW